MGDINFNANDYDPDAGFDPIPAGTEVKAWIVPVGPEDPNGEHVQWKDVKPPKKGQYLQLTWTIVEGPHKGRKVWDRLNLKNPSKEAKDIAHKTLSGICAALGTKNLTDTQQLRGKPVVLKLKVRPAQGQFEATNEIARGGYKSANGAPAGAAGAGETVTTGGPPSDAGGDETPSWAR